MQIQIQRDRSDGYSVIANAIMRDKRVSCKARGLWSTVMSLPDDWDISIAGLRKILPDGRDAIRSCMLELAQYGYCKRTRLQNRKGQFVAVQYTFVERPRKLPRPENPTSVKPTSDNPTQLNTKRIKYKKKSNYRVSSQAVTHESREVNWDDEALNADLALFDAWVDSGVELLDPQPFLSPQFSPRESKRDTNGILEPIPKVAHSIMYRLCFRADTEAEHLMITSGQRGKVASILGKLRDAGADFHKLHLFEGWWVQNWRSRDKATQQYQAPRPEQVLEFWHEAMKAGIKPETVKVERPKQHIGDLSEIMRQHRNEQS